MPTKKKTEFPEEMTTPLEAQDPQTEEDTAALPAEGVPDDACDASLSQTETDSAEADASSTGIPDGVLNKPTESQTEVKKPRRCKKAETESAQSDTEPENAPNAKEDGVDAISRPKRKRTYTKPSVSVLSIDDRPTVETEADKAKNDLLDLIESQRSGRILTGTIQGVEQSADNPRHAFAVLYHGEFKVIIPAAEAVEPPEDYRGRDPDEVLHYMLTKRLGAEVDYIVKGIDPKSGIAAASRLEAMRARRKEMYFGTDRDGNNRIYAGVCAEARVVSAIRAGIFIDLFGVESYIPLKELSYQRWMDAAAHFQPGQRILVKVLDVDRSDRDNVRVSASVKQAGENPYEKALRRYSVGNRYVGTVSMVDVNVPTSSMEPTLKTGSVLLGIRIIGSIETGDIIVFRHNEKLFVKRVAAVGGDIIEENGQTLTVPAECFYVLGDNTEHSYDSRCWKEPFVERQDVLAVVIIP